MLELAQGGRTHTEHCVPELGDWSLDPPRQLDFVGLESGEAVGLQRVTQKSGSLPQSLIQCWDVQVWSKALSGLAEDS